MNQVRGIMMLLAGGFAFFQGWRIHAAGKPAWWALGLGVLAISLGVWRLTRKPPRPLV
jgi:uncharacterized membrane protein HdeD (DUF308 family)